MLSIFSVLSETVATVSLSTPPTVATHDAEQTSVTSRRRRCWAESVTHVGKQLPVSFHKPHSGTSSTISYSPIPSPITSFSSDSPLSTSITPSFFHSRLKTYLFHKSYPRGFTSYSQTASMDFCLERFF